MQLTDTSQFKTGKQVEAVLDQFFRAQGYIISQTTLHQERVLCLGDRIFVRDSQSFYVEYKSGIQTYYTGNVFFETVSMDTTKTPGWIFTCQADYIFYAALLNGMILKFSPVVLRASVDDLRRQFREVKTSKRQNDGYKSWGILVPLDYAKERLAEEVIYI